MLQQKMEPASLRKAAAKRIGTGAEAVSVEVKGLVKSYGSVVGVAGVGFQLDAGKTATLLGPSGCGKTTTLRCVAGLEVPDEGLIRFGDQTVYDGATGVILEPEQRNIGMVFQSYAIWPHMTVAGNVGYPLKVRRTPKSEIIERVNFILSLVGLSELFSRPASALSGGQQQRVALARALIHQPRIVLFDEPLSNLDANLRERMRAELLLLQAELGFTAIYVTHDQEEAMALSDEVVVMNSGLVEQRGTPVEVYQQPGTLFAARFLGCSNVIRGQVASVGEDGVVCVELAFGLRLFGRWRDSGAPGAGDEAELAFRPGSVTSGANRQDSSNIIEGEILTVGFLGHSIDYTIAIDTLRISAEMSPEIMMPAGSVAKLHIPPAQVHVFRAHGPTPAAEASDVEIQISGPSIDATPLPAG
jgi:iron(III) transport system ATP-binding protein